ncbi:hypothetical protein GUJ93_ZPchr0002g23683 [Zizania palustris]|uniref:Large ribosomal subunit protein uL6 alpha-beta domain-containing protein n=1 Tax=Zizania palustris TaxID=103762 RepID=A0A8J5VV10_ZIZPA|nr:hypothetical protein GUJ93_ZPchr0002g23683 [Zizania palustris]
MKTILASETMDIPEEVTVQVAAKVVTVEGPRGKLTRNFKHLNLDFQLLEGGRKLQVDAWFGTRRTMAAIRTAISHVQNLITGVTKGYRYRMRFVYAHFPINASITNSNTAIEIRNFLGEKKVRKVDMLDGVTILRSEKVKDELILDGNDVELVSRSAALINQKCHVKKKDIRKFLDASLLLGFLAGESHCSWLASIALLLARVVRIWDRWRLVGELLLASAWRPRMETLDLISTNALVSCSKQPLRLHSLLFM